MKATYIDHMGDDSRVVDAARVSFHKIAENYTKEQNDRLLSYLARHGHFTPFTHPQITLREKVPIFIARQRFKHMVGFTYNEVSRRYVDDEPEFFTPSVWRERAENKKQGSGEEKIDLRQHLAFESGDWEQAYNDYTLFELEAEVRERTLELYKSLLRANVAPEQARMVLPQSMYTEYFTTGSLAAFARAYKLRSEDSSQKEIQDLAKQWDEIIRPLFPVSWEVLTK